MSFAHFIARRILFDKDRRDRLSRPIVGIAVGGIVVGMAVMILTLGITQGFQREVRAKVTGAGGHLQIGAMQQTDPKETPRVPIDQPFYPSLDTVPGIAHIQIHATKPGIIETEQDIQGVVVKGVGSDHDWTFLRKHLVSDQAYLIDAIEKVLGEQWDLVAEDSKTEDEFAFLGTSGSRALRLLAEGYDNEEIARRCGVSRKTVERWIEQIYRDLGIDTKGALNPRVAAARRFFFAVGVPGVEK